MTLLAAEGLEYDWLASDLEGHVALFATAGCGWAPDAFLRDPDRHDSAIDALLAPPRTTDADLAPAARAEVSGRWPGLGERGVFVFDADRADRSYVVIARPRVPTVRGLVPASAREALDSIERASGSSERARVLAPDGL